MLDCYLVLFICTYDDIVIGVYSHDAAGLELAQQRKAEAIKEPDMRFKFETPQSVDTTEQAVIILEVREGVKISELERTNFEDIESEAA